MSVKKLLQSLFYSIFQFVKSFLQILVDFIYTPACIQCNQRLDHRGLICEPCKNKILNAMKPHFQMGKGDFYHLQEDIFFDKVITFWNYTPDMEQLIFQMKYQRKKKLGLLLGQILGKTLQTVYHCGEDCIIVPVPLHKVRCRERGYNQSEILCKGMGDYIVAPIQCDCLIRCRHTSTQTKLSAQERQENVKDAFGVSKSCDVKGKTIVLVDDVITTGATVNNCAACLKKAGVQKVVGIALARPQLE